MRFQSVACMHRNGKVGQRGRQWRIVCVHKHIRPCKSLTPPDNQFATGGSPIVCSPMDNSDHSADGRAYEGNARWARAKSGRVALSGCGIGTRVRKATARRRSSSQPFVTEVHAKLTQGARSRRLLVSRMRVVRRDLGPAASRVRLRLRGTNQQGSGRSRRTWEVFVAWKTWRLGWRAGRSASVPVPRTGDDCRVRRQSWHRRAQDSAYAQSVTAQMAANFAAGGAAINRLAQAGRSGVAGGADGPRSPDGGLHRRAGREVLDEFLHAFAAGYRTCRLAVNQASVHRRGRSWESARYGHRRRATARGRLSPRRVGRRDFELTRARRGCGRGFRTPGSAWGKEVRGTIKVTRPAALGSRPTSLAA